METKANYLLIGVFTLACIAGAFALFLWLAKVEIDRQYAYYDILFDDVSGLGAAGDVRYNGLPVGQVVDLRLDPEDSSKVRIRIEVGADTPVNVDTVATLQAQGVTGVSYVALSGGSPTSAALPENAEIPSERSALQSVFEGAPVLLEKAVTLLEDVNAVFDDQNRQAVSDILQNTAAASARLETTLTNFEALSQDLAAAAREVTAFAERLDALADTAETTLTTATETLDTASETLTSAQGSFETATAFMETDLPVLVEDVRGVAATANRVIDQVGQDVSDVAVRLDEVATVGRTTLQSANTAFDESLKAIDAIYDAMTGAETTLASAQQTFTSVNEILDTQVDGMITDLRGAVSSFSGTVTEVSEAFSVVAVEVQTASASAAQFLGTLDDLVQDNRRQVSNFLALGLPEFVRLIEEGRLLFDSLDRLVSRIERDPARFLLGTTNSEFRR